MITDRERYLTTGQVARLLGLNTNTVRWRCVKGRIPGAYQIDDGRSYWRIPKSWVDGILNRPVLRRSRGKVLGNARLVSEDS